MPRLRRAYSMEDHCPKHCYHLQWSDQIATSEIVPNAVVSVVSGRGAPIEHFQMWCNFRAFYATQDQLFRNLH